MPLNQYRDLSVIGSHMQAGFQFEFACAHCSNSWRSPFKPYRMGQLSTLLHKFTFLLPGMANAGRASTSLADVRARSARDSELASAMRQAESQFVNCEVCHDVVCHDCFNASEGCCDKCAVERRGGARSAGGGGATASAGADAAGAYCPNCRTPSDGGRFCAECGYDLASTHKSCPACGAMTSRSARYCTDCGHAF